MYTKFEDALFREPGDRMRFSYPADHELAPFFEEQMSNLLREYKGEGEFVSFHHPDEPGARDDYPDSTALMVMGVVSAAVGDILFV